MQFWAGWVESRVVTWLRCGMALGLHTALIVKRCKKGRVLVLFFAKSCVAGFILCLKYIGQKKSPERDFFLLGILRRQARRKEN